MPFHAPSLRYAIQPPIPIRIHKPLLCHILPMLLAAAIRQLTRQPPRRIHLVHDNFNELQVRRVRELWLRQDGGELGFGGGKVEGGGRGGVLVEREQVLIGGWDNVVVCCRGVLVGWA